MTDETLARIADALEKLVDAYAQAQRRDHYALSDRYAANEARQREEQMDDAWQSRDWETVERLQDEARQREEAQADPLDEDDHRDRLAHLGDGGGRVKRLTRREERHWHTEGHKCSDSCHEDDFSLAWWASEVVLTFAPDASPAPQEAAQGDTEGECDAVEGGGPAGPNLNVQIKVFCHECGHGIEQHMGFGCYPPAAGEGSGCTCRLSVTDVARHLIAQATS